jgi:YVTN family beta-propeller protein
MKPPLSVIVISLCMCGLVLVGCTKDPSGPDPVIPTPSAKGVYVINEGLFQHGDATLSYYDVASHTAFQNVFSSVNHRPLGDLANSMCIRGNNGYVVVDGSATIEIIDLTTNVSTGTIDIGAGLSPRQMVFVNDSLALVTCLYDASVRLVNVRSGSLVQRIPVGQNPEGIAIAQGKAFVANSGLGLGRSVSVINLTTLSATDTLTVGDNPVAVAVDADGMVDVVCVGFYNNFGDPNDDTPAKVIVIDPSSTAIVDSILIGGHAFKIGIDPNGFAYVPSTDSVALVDTRSRRVVRMFAGGAFYSVGVDEVSGDVYLSDAKDFQQHGTVSVYSSSGQLKTQFDAGVIPGAFAFKN